jgi:hypothetical protein
MPGRWGNMLIKDGKKSASTATQGWSRDVLPRKLRLAGELSAMINHTKWPRAVNQN